MSNSSNEKWAILIGIDFYAQGTARPGLELAQLKGCVSDVALVESFLRAGFGVCESNLFRLTATTPIAAPHDAPIELPENRPTYQIIIDKFIYVTQQARRGDPVYIHYSGHGARAQTIFPQLKQPVGQDLDEVLVPYDIRTPGGRYVRDVEIAALVKGMVDKGLIVTMVIDACHSGSATRTSAPTIVRCLSKVDHNVLESDTCMLPPSQLVEMDPTAAALGESRNAKRKNSWLVEPRGYTLLAACRSHEEATECEFNGKWHGVFTHSLIDSLNLGWQPCTYEMLHQRIRAKVNTRFKNQTPIMSGEGDRVFFGSSRIRPFYSVKVIGVTYPVQINSTLTLGSGLVHGTSVGNEFAIYRADNFDPSDRALRLATVNVTDVQTTSCTAVVIDVSREVESEIDIGYSAVLTTFNKPTQQRTVKLLQRSTQSGIDQVGALGKLREQLESPLFYFTTLVQDDFHGSTHFQVVVNDMKEYEIWDTNHQVIANLYPPIYIAETDAAGRTVARLTHLAKYHNVWELDNPDRSCAIASALTVKLLGWRRSLGEELKDFDTLSNIYEVNDGDIITLEVKNLAKNGAAINVTILDLQPGWSITQVHPARPGVDHDTLEAGKSLRLEFVMSASGSTLVNHVDILKVFAINEPTSFRWLELPSLSGRHRGGVSMPPRPGSLEVFLASFVTNRKAIPVTKGDWATASVMVRTRKSSESQSH
jgi:hypothetical protein